MATNGSPVFPASRWSAGEGIRNADANKLTARWTRLRYAFWNGTQGMKLSIRAKLILAICLPLLAVYLTVLVTEYRTGRTQAIEQMQGRLTELTGHQAAHLDGELAVVAQVARSTAAFVTIALPPNEADIYALLQSNLRDNPKIFGSCMAFEPGVFRPGLDRFAPYVCRGPERTVHTKDLATDGYDYSRWDWYQGPKEKSEARWTEPYFDKGGGDILMCTYSAPFQRKGAFAGVVTVDLSLGQLRQRMADVEVSNGYCMIVSRTGTFVSHPDPTLIMNESIFGLGEKHDAPELADLGEAMIAGRTGVRQITDPRTGQPARVVFAPVESVGWSLAAVIPEEAVLADVHERLNRQMIVLLVGLELILIIVLLVSAWITRPLGRLATVAQEVARGNLEVQVTDVRGRDEIAQFAATFNRMVTDLKTSLDARIRETAAREAMQRELQVARQIQTSLLPMARPPFPGRDEFSLDAQNEAAKFMAGDFFDFWFIDEQRLALVMADVSGKGVPAAMFMAVARTSIRNFSQPDRSPGETLAVVNRAIAGQNEEQMFVTVFLAHYHVGTGELVYANAGHNPPVIVRSGGEAEMLGPSTGPVIGVWDDATFADAPGRLKPGDLLLLYTDGVTEARAADGRMLGEVGLKQTLTRLRDRPVEEICRTIIAEVDEFRRHEQQDDVTLLALRRST
jgi:sigma-B regulation protein RsbU (phosphoserine phosphatase)